MTELTRSHNYGVNLGKLRQKFAKNLKRIREERNLTQERLAEKAEMNPRYIQQLEGKNTPNVKLDTIEKFSKILRVKSQDFFK